MQAVRLTVNYFLQKKRQAGRKAESWDNNKKTELAGKIGLSDQERSKFLPKKWLVLKSMPILEYQILNINF
jgi:hypothetical protein